MNRYTRLIAASQHCAITCEGSLLHAVSLGDAETTQRLRECIDVCLFCSKALARQSPFSLEIGCMCARVCDWCAERCALFSNSHLRVCTSACRDCVREWQELANSREEITL